MTGAGLFGVRGAERRGSDARSSAAAAAAEDRASAKGREDGEGGAMRVAGATRCSPRWIGGWGLVMSVMRAVSRFERRADAWMKMIRRPLERIEWTPNAGEALGM
jgi:hypothetical protein